MKKEKTGAKSFSISLVFLPATFSRLVFSSLGGGKKKGHSTHTHTHTHGRPWQTTAGERTLPLSCKECYIALRVSGRHTPFTSALIQTISSPRRNPLPSMSLRLLLSSTRVFSSVVFYILVILGPMPMWFDSSRTIRRQDFHTDLLKLSG